MKVFISQPFYGRTENEIMLEQKDILEEFKNFIRWTSSTPIEVIDTYHSLDAPDGAGRLWYLGNSISLMDQADAVIFSKDYRNATGCVVEECAAILYGKQIFYC